jgi:hypothetical protein
MLYTILGRVIWKIFRGYFHHQFPKARRNLVAAGIAAVVVAGAGGAKASRRHRQRP